MKVKLLLLTFSMMVVMTMSVFALTLEGEIDLNWVSNETVEITVSGGDYLKYNCSEVTNDNYQSFDKEMDVKVKRNGVRYETTIIVNWKDGSVFTVETENNDFDFDCGQITSDYNTFDTNKVITFDVTEVSDQDMRQFEQIIQKYLNYSDSIGQCKQELALCDITQQTNYDKWVGCEEEGGAYKNEVKHLQVENREIESLSQNVSGEAKVKENEIDNLKSQLETSRTESTSLRSQVTAAETKAKDAEQKAGNNLLLGAVGVFILSKVLGKKDERRPEEMNELYK